MSPLIPAPLNSLRVSKYQIPAYQNFPNTSLRPFPFMIYHSVFPSSTSSVSASSIEAHLRKVGIVEPAWRYTMYTQHHYHSTVDEVLVVYSGAARLCFGGGPANPDKVEVDASVGDVMIVPAGVGHGLLEDKGGFGMVGSYPKGSGNWDMCTGQKGEKENQWEIIKNLEWLKGDPIYGDEGPVVNVGETTEEGH
ncbi:uncharacterized protein I303_103258 [Kwoniella dejecticola CBS 10117]|uniref:Cupin type-1 domain-containing protein n=1 Tax=Kwoniella dejecticola CBS 10117 TaxID=1296121 RepID=A0A1A6AB06_9TREE|nr:uncharacterized protein I303_03281 [Kwoniella dejecticola CBS 10117]OBR87256.1 hypothetical protein I303_03281 [Kwoniella dejecticola CBS 10117]